MSLKNGAIVWVKQYETHPVIYYGLISQRDNSVMIEGRWEITDMSLPPDEGTFRLNGSLN